MSTEGITMNEAPAWPGGLTTSEARVAPLLATGYTRAEVARRLGITSKTLDTHRANLLRKLGLGNTVLLARFAIREGLVSSAAEDDAPASAADPERDPAGPRHRARDRGLRNRDRAGHLHRGGLMAVPPMKTMKMWIGNLDGDRSGLVIASSKERARWIVGTSRADFDSYWVLQPGVDQGLEFEVLYTRTDATSKWQQGRCQIASPGAPAGAEG